MVEIDRGTMPIARSDSLQTSFERKMRAYLTAHAGKQHEKHFGWKTFPVLTVTTAKATEMVSVAIGSGNAAALNYFIAEKYLKAFGELAKSPNQKVLMLPIEATSVLSSLAGIAEIAKSTFGEEGEGGASALRPSTPPTGPAIPPPTN